MLINRGVAGMHNGELFSNKGRYSSAGKLTELEVILLNERTETQR